MPVSDSSFTRSTRSSNRVRRGPYAGLGVHILRSTLFEVLVSGGKLAGGERFTSAGCHDDAHRGQGTLAFEDTPFKPFRGPTFQALP